MKHCYEWSPAKWLTNIFYVILKPYFEEGDVVAFLLDTDSLMLELFPEFSVGLGNPSLIVYGKRKRKILSQTQNLYPNGYVKGGV